MKDKLLSATRDHAKAVAEIQKRVGRYSGAQIQSGSLLADVQTLASVWFDRVKDALEAGKVAPDLVGEANTVFDKMLRLSKMKPRKTTLIAELTAAVNVYKKLVHVIETSSFASSQALSIAPFIEGLQGDETDYLDEAQRCLTVEGLRACVVLGWCATVSRIHRKIEDLGFDKFSQATREMAGKTTGRFKPFKKQFQIESRSELQTVFDTDLLWVLEYLELIDNNQHQRLRHCFEFRNNSAHPGLAPIKGPNLYSFYSDISEIILKNPKFALP
ncbi:MULTISPECIES: hypothetical protein [unclassified Bradyrhizobium]|uniref:hypothetical protein n=1 Tax=unclassified Bradyrhizobium TaxID=2631580 RepID=UPI00211F0980|nr:MULTISPECIES: hypothetical protein [unclassified Bradyrhizobium]MDD1533843.1 hypothetical protein [Bradyrhizobium sp. WBOS8]MDD1583562.1 hypothetical protein [Bradyrhizobium sp. WBOS4]UUO48797.1 hypothetical protein DCM78_18900 [Bradyrhizobium sp. WBOS04]UUO62617.1 hypothetical protein DCM80_27775 [Bradyrhizobium sp. WBOS08]